MRFKVSGSKFKVYAVSVMLSVVEGSSHKTIIKIVSPARSFDSVNSAQDDRDSMNLNDG